MASNLVSLIMQMLTPDLVSRIAAALGLDRTLVNKALEAIVPGLLASLTSVASTRDGARKLSEAAARQSPNVLESLDRLVRGSERAVDDGADLLSPLLGRSGTKALAEAVGKFAGLPAGTGSSLLGMVAPLVMGALGTQQRAGGLDAAGFAQMLTSQKGDIEAMMPAGFATLLKGTGLLDGSASESIAAPQPLRPVGTTPLPPPPYPARRVAASSSWTRSLVWMVPLALVAALGLWFLYPTGERVAEQAPAVPVPTQTGALQFAQGLEQRLASLRSLGGTGIEAANQITGAFGSLTATLQGISDQATAQSALPKIQEAATQVDKVLRSADQLRAEGRKALSGFIAEALPTIRQLCDRVLAIPGVSAAIKPTVDELRTKLEAIAQQA